VRLKFLTILPANDRKIRLYYDVKWHLLSNLGGSRTERFSSLPQHHEAWLSLELKKNPAPPPCRSDASVANQSARDLSASLGSEPSKVFHCASELVCCTVQLQCINPNFTNTSFTNRLGAALNG
jgi:hypothetical protein